MSAGEGSEELCFEHSWRFRLGCAWCGVALGGVWDCAGLYVLPKSAEFLEVKTSC